MPDDEKKVPTIILKVTDAEKFNIEIEFETPSLQCARAMLTEALHTIQSMIEDANAVEFQSKMNRAAQSYRAMQKKPSIL